MIEAYKQTEKTYGFRSFAEYIASTTVAFQKKDVEKYIKYYLLSHTCNKRVKAFLKIFLRNKKNILNKVTIVWTDSSRNTCFVVRPDSVFVENFQNPFDAIDYFNEEAETIFLCMSEKENAQIVIDKKNLRMNNIKEKIREQLLKESNKRKTWEEEYNKLRKEYIDNLLDKYNDYKLLFHLFGDLKYQKGANSCLREMKQYPADK